jgi:sec-independent protein translocase protein TatA
VELFSPGHLIVLLVIVGVLFFGWKQLPDMARSAGKSLRIFRTEIKGMSDEAKAATADVRGAGQSTWSDVPAQPLSTAMPVDATVSPAVAPVVIPVTVDSAETSRGTTLS